jgi:hypothetical protein
MERYIRINYNSGFSDGIEFTLKEVNIDNKNQIEIKAKPARRPDELVQFKDIEYFDNIYKTFMDLSFIEKILNSDYDIEFSNVCDDYNTFIKILIGKNCQSVSFNIMDYERDMEKRGIAEIAKVVDGLFELFGIKSSSVISARA